MHDDSIVEQGIAQLVVKYGKMGGKMDLDYMIKFASAVMNRLELTKRTHNAPAVLAAVAEMDDSRGNRA